MGQSGADADEVAAGLGIALGRSAPASISFADFVCCYHWRAPPSHPRQSEGGASAHAYGAGFMSFACWLPLGVRSMHAEVEVPSSCMLSQATVHAFNARKGRRSACSAATRSDQSCRSTRHREQRM